MTRWEGRESWYVGQAGQIHGSKSLVDVDALRVGCDSHATTGRKNHLWFPLKGWSLKFFGGSIKEDAVMYFLDYYIWHVKRVYGKPAS